MNQDDKRSEDGKPVSWERVQEMLATFTALDREEAGFLIDKLAEDQSIDVDKTGTCFKIKEAAALVGRTPESIRDAEKRKLVSPPKLNPETGRRLGYSLEQINGLRRYFGTFPYRKHADPPAVINIHSARAGVGKSCICMHLAQGFAIRGYRVLIIDADPEATATSMLGFNPDRHVGHRDTIGPVLLGETSGSHPRAWKTGVDQLDLIPASLRLVDMRSIFDPRAQPDRSQLERVRGELHRLAADYDIVFIDSASASGYTAATLPLLYAANALLIPHSPRRRDRKSTHHVLRLLEQRYDELGASGVEPQLNWIRGVINEYRKEISDVETNEAPKDMSGIQILETKLRHRIQIAKAFSDGATVFERRVSAREKPAQKEALKNVEALVAEIEKLIQTTWPTKVRELRSSGYI